MCQSDECANGICSTVVSSGSGIFCSVEAPGLGSRGGTDVSLGGLFAAFAGATYRRRRRRVAA
jgi:hypothetical protein